MTVGRATSPTRLALLSSPSARISTTPRPSIVAEWQGDNGKTPPAHRVFAMWVWMDRIGIILFDATLSTAVFLTLIVLAMLSCRQPARRILLARVALLASLAILPLVGGGR